MVTIKPELRTLVFGQPHTQQFFLAFDIDTQCQEHRFVNDAAALPDFRQDTQIYVQALYGV